MAEKTTISYKGKKYSVCTYNIERLNKYGITVSEDYIDSILGHELFFNNEKTISDGDIDFLLLEAYDNICLYSPNGLGKIVLYNCLGEKIRVFDCFSDVFSVVKDKEFLLGFENLDQKNIIPKKEKVAFFGKEITTVSANNYLVLLNKKFRSILNKVYGKTNTFYLRRYENDKHIKNTIPFDEYVNIEIKKECFGLGVLMRALSRRLRDELKKKTETSYAEYCFQIKNLLDRYSINQKTVFKEVANLSELKNESGIYILCSNFFERIYIGISSTSVEKRILCHFSNPTSEFDEYHVPQDFNKIYYLKTKLELLYPVEQDCIASVDKDFLFNALAGGNEIMGVTWEEYCKSDYLLDSRTLKKVIRFAKN